MRHADLPTRRPALREDRRQHSRFETVGQTALARALSRCFCVLPFVPLLVLAPWPTDAGAYTPRRCERDVTFQPFHAAACG